MLSPKLRNRVDLLFCHFVRKDASCIDEPNAIADWIFEIIQPECGSLYLKDVRSRVQTLVVRSTLDTDYKSNGGRPQRWRLPMTSITIPLQYASALKEIALEWQENEPTSLPF